QFKLSVGKFEGVQEATGRIAGLNYRLEAVRTLTASAVDNCAPSVVTAIAKYHMTEMMRQSLTDAMDVHGGRGIMVGPRNYLVSAYQAIPVAITVEGANILTRSLMIFGQGAIRCHPYVFPEMEAARQNDLSEFDKLLWGHIGFSMNRGVRALTLGLTGGALAKAPVDGPTAKYYKQLERMSASLAFVSDVTMGVLGGELKRKERLSARLGDVLSHLYMATAVLKYYEDEGRPEEDLPHVQWCVEDSLNTIYEAFDEFFANFPVGIVGSVMRRMVFPFGRSYRAVSDDLNGKLADMMMEPTELRDRLSQICFLPKDANDPVGLLEVAFDKLIAVEPLYNKYYKALSKGELSGMTLEARLEEAVAQGVLTSDEAEQVGEYDRLRYEAVMTDAFTKEYLAGTAFNPEAAASEESEQPTAKVA
uniref:acyl-CoA dehydrogenase domain-containing protein n=1 Tax=uncultured Abyssibacter sp. TaxID=2320202 RepID=UPI0032B1FBDF